MTVILTYRAFVSLISYFSKSVVVPLLLPEKTLVKDLPSSDTDIVKVFVLSFPLYHDISTLQRDFSVSRSKVIEDPSPRFDHLVSGLPSIALVGGKVDWLPLAKIRATDKALHVAAAETTGLAGMGAKGELS